MTQNHQIGFGDNVRIKRTPATEAAGVADLIGQVFGETTPSVTNVQVIGELKEDFALNVSMKDRKDTLWFAADLVELLDHGAGTEISLDGVKGKFVRTESGEWKAIGTDVRGQSILARLFSAFKRRGI